MRSKRTSFNSIAPLNIIITVTLCKMCFSCIVALIPKNLRKIFKRKTSSTLEWPKSCPKHWILKKLKYNNKKTSCINTQAFNSYTVYFLSSTHSGPRSYTNVFWNIHTSTTSNIFSICTFLAENFVTFFLFCAGNL